MPFLKELKLYTSSDNVTDEVHILKSISLIEKVVKRLNLNVTYHWKNGMKEMPVYKNSPIKVASYNLTSATVYEEIEEGFQLEVSPINESRYRLLYEEESLGSFTYGEVVQMKHGEIKILKKEEWVNNTEARFFITFYDFALVAEQIYEDLSIDLVDKNVSVIQLSLLEKNPEKAIDILNLMVEFYNADAKKDKYKVSENTLSFVEGKLGNISEELFEIERNIEYYKRRNEISSTSEKDLEIFLQESSKYTASQSEIEIELNTLSSLTQSLNSNDRFQLIPSNLSIGNATLQQLIVPYNDLILKRQKLLETATFTNPRVKSINQQLLSTGNTIKGTIDNYEKDLERKKIRVASLNQELKSKIRRVPSQERGLLEMKRKQAVKENLYLHLLEKKEEMEISLAAAIPSARIIDKPRVNSKPVSPNIPLILFGGLVGGFFFPFFFVFVKELMQDSISTEQEVKAISKVPIIGSIYNSQSKESIVIKFNSHTPIAEKFRLLRTNLLLSSKGKPLTILVTSNQSGEGKSFVGYNLACSFALTRKKTVFVEMDLRSPSLKEYVPITQIKRGITDFAINQARIEDIIQTDKVNGSLDFISSGSSIQNPNEILTEESIAQLFTYLQSKYDVIIVDSPPIGIVSDAFILNEFATNTLFVVRANYTNKNLIKSINDLIIQGNLKQPSILLNGVRINKAQKNKYTYFEALNN